MTDWIQSRTEPVRRSKVSGLGGPRLLALGQRSTTHDFSHPEPWKQPTQSHGNKSLQGRVHPCHVRRRKPGNSWTQSPGSLPGGILLAN